MSQEILIHMGKVYFEEVFAYIYQKGLLMERHLDRPEGKLEAEKENLRQKSNGALFCAIYKSLNWQLIRQEGMKRTFFWNLWSISLNWIVFKICDSSNKRRELTQDQVVEVYGQM